MEVLKCLFLVLALVFEAIGVNGSSDCTLSLNKDFGSPSPVYFQNGGYLAPNSRNGEVVLDQTQAVVVACPGDKGHLVLSNVSKNFDVGEAYCISNNTFRLDRWVGHFKDIRCSAQPQYSVAETKETCAGGNKIYRVGYKVQRKFHTLYKACFNRNLQNTLYVKHHVTPTTRLMQTGGSRPQFTEGDLFGKTRMSQLYKTANQRARIDALLGAGKGDEYVTKTQFLTRGHLAPRADFTLRAAQRASFHYINTAPQWMRGNAGDWAALEEALRRRAQSTNASLVVYTGTHGVATLAARDGRPHELYLGTDANNNNVVPVPLYFYKVVYDPRHKTAAAFISINSSYYNRTETARLSFCDDTCHDNSQYSWLRWRNDGTHSFCCEYQQFAAKVGSLPRLDVKGVFY